MADNQGFQNMDDKRHHDASVKGGKKSGEEQDMSELGRRGAAAQPREAKVEGGKRGGSHSSRG